MARCGREEESHQLLEGHEDTPSSYEQRTASGGQKNKPGDLEGSCASDGLWLPKSESRRAEGAEKNRHCKGLPIWF